MSSSRWRVQASWDYGTERRSYAPLFVDSADAAYEVREGMLETLVHFPGLEVDVVEVDIDVAEREAAALEIAEVAPPVLHIFNADGEILCGAATDEVDVMVAEDFVPLSTGEFCPLCLSLHRPQL